MALSKKKVVVSVDLEAQAKQFNQVIENSKNALKGLENQLTPRQFEQLSRALARMEDTISNIRKNAKAGFSSNSEFDSATKKITELGTSYERFLSNLRSFNIDPKTVEPATEEFAQLRTEIEETSRALKKLQSEKTRPKNRPKGGYIGVDSATEEAMASAARAGDISTIGTIAQQKRNANAAERQKLGSSVGKMAKKYGVDKGDLSDYFAGRIEKLNQEIATLGDGRSDKTASQRRKELEKEIELFKERNEKVKEYQRLNAGIESINQAERDYKGQARDTTNTAKKLAELNEERARQVAGPQAEVQGHLNELENSLPGVTKAQNDFNAALADGNSQFLKQQENAKNISDLQNYLTSLVSTTAIFMRLRQAVQQAFREFQEIDSELNAISVVTGKTMDELWGGFSNLNSQAQQYGVTTKNVIEVQKLYYQQGRSAVEVTQLTGETLRFAKISGLDFANATDYMTSALNAYNIAAKDASEITDTYAALSAAAAVDSQELAVAMSKVASMSASAGSSFKDTSAYLAKMIEVTREAPEALGTALLISA